MSKADSLFEQMYAADAEKKLEANKELVERKLRRSYASAIDGLEVNKLEGESRLKQLLTNFVNPNFSDIIAEKVNLQKIDAGIQHLKDSHMLVFGETL